MDMRQRLNSLLETARENDQLFQKTQNLVLSLLEANSLDEIAITVQSRLREDYQVDTNSLILLGNQEELGNINALIVSSAAANDAIGSILNTNKATCGVLLDNEMAFLFPDAPKAIGSAAVTPLYQEQMFGVLAIGSFDSERYRSSMGTMFLSYIASVLNRIMPRFLP